MIEANQIVRQSKFGIEELLRANARVLYEYFFSTRHVGRVLDFLFYEAKDALAAVDDGEVLEYRVRQILETSIFNGFANYRTGEKSKCIEIEYGWDDVRMITSAVFWVEQTCAGFMPGEKPNDGVAGRIQKFIENISTLADEVVVRFDPRSGRFQIVGIINTAGNDVATKKAIDYVDVSALSPSEDGNSTHSTQTAASTVQPEALSAADIKDFTEDEKKFERERGRLTHVKEAEEEKQAVIEARVHELEERKRKKAMLDRRSTGSTVEDPEIISRERRSHENLADLEFRDREKPSKGTAFSFVEHLEKQANDQIETKKRTALGERDRQLIADTSSDVIRVRGGGSESEQDGPEVVLKTERLSTDEEAVSVGAIDRINTRDDFLTVKNLSIDLSKAPVESPLSEKENEDVEEVLQLLLKAVRAELVVVLGDMPEDRFEEIFRTISIRLRETFLQGIHHITRVRNIQLVTKIRHYKEQLSLMSGNLESVKAQLEEAKATVKETPVATDSGPTNQTGQAMSKGLLQDVVREKAALNEKVRQIDDHLRKREFDFRTLEASMVEQIRLKDEGVKQKQFAVEKMKEMMTTMMENLERYKKLVATSVSEAEMKMKFAASEKLLASAKESNEKLTKRTDELQKKWSEEFTARSQAQEELSRTKRHFEEFQRRTSEASLKSVDTRELAEVTTARDRAIKQGEELRRQNKELQEKLNALMGSGSKVAAGKQPGAAKAGETTDAESRHKLEHAAKLNKALQEELSRQKKRFDDLKLEETKLRVEVAKLQNQLKNAGKSPPGGTKSGFGKTSK